MFQNLVTMLNTQQTGLFIIRFGIGLIFIKHGFDKLIGGPPTWIWLGSQMRLLGITFAPLMWGIAQLLTELLGGMCLIIGFQTRIAAGFLCFGMLVATIYHVSRGDEWKIYSYPLSLLVVSLGLVFTGSGLFSLDGCLR